MRSGAFHVSNIKEQTMQNNSITLAVDTANTGVTSSQVYTRLSEETNKSLYGRADHSLDHRHEMTFLRKYPVRSGNFKGTAKPTVKFTDSVQVAGVDGNNVDCLLVGEVSFNIPVGVSDAALLEFRQRLIAALDTDSVMTALMSRLEI